VTLTPIAILIGMRISAAATLGSAVDPWVPSSGFAATLAVRSLADAPFPTISVEDLSGVETTFYNVNTRETETFFLRFDGVMSKDDEKRITHLFRCKRTNHEMTPNRGLLQLLARISDHYRGHVLELVSAHRHNRGTSRTSKHWSGHAVDLRVRGVNVKEVRSFVWKMNDPIGLGYYREQQFVHVDYRPIEGKIAWDQRTEGSTYHYHPAWSGGPPKKQKQAKRERPSRRRPLRSAKPTS
jgi:uncharacterized protein YcbK (DUF882 family)